MNKKQVHKQRHGDPILKKATEKEATDSHTCTESSEPTRLPAAGMPEADKEIHAADLLKGNKVHDSTPPNPRKPRPNYTQTQRQQTIKAQAALLTTDARVIEAQTAHIENLTGLRQTLKEYVEDKRQLEKNQKEQIKNLTTQNESAARVIEAGKEEKVKLKEMVRLQGEVIQGLQRENGIVERQNRSVLEMRRIDREMMEGLELKIGILEEYVRVVKGERGGRLEGLARGGGQTLAPGPQ